MMKMKKESRSPPKMICCFWYSSKTEKGKDDYDAGDCQMENKDVVANITTLSAAEQNQRLKKAREEEERVIKEAEIVIEWVKRESVRMDASVIKSIVSEDEYEPIK